MTRRNYSIAPATIWRYVIQNFVSNPHHKKVLSARIIDGKTIPCIAMEQGYSESQVFRIVKKYEEMLFAKVKQYL